jgi:predicted 3-demethylubiquinone-9 3-methyltransferase (glyoxalase superfamily)
MAQKIVPCLWFDNNTEEAMEFYVSVFGKNSKIHSIKRYEKGMQTPGIEHMEGKVLTGIFELWGHRFMALDGGPIFKLNPSISFMVNFDPSQDKDAKERIDEVWKRLSEGGKVLMPIQEYPFSKKYGWTEDKYGVSWQLILTDPEGEERPLIIPSLLFVREKSGKAKEARNFYLSIFKRSKEGTIAYFEADNEMGQKKGDVMFSDFKLEGQWFAAMDGGDPHDFDFNEALSFEVNCEDQEEVDYYWEKLTTNPEFEQCGWLKDKYGVSWQIIPKRLGELLEDDPDNKVLNAMLGMKKIDVKKLEEAHKE